MDNFKVKANYNVNDIEKLIRFLCDDETGCPWDRVQTHETIRKNFLEEVYEVCEAIDKQDTELLREELGDVLLQVVLHSEFERKKGEFSLDDVADGICKKLVSRHPHMFSDFAINDSDSVLQNWEAIKRKEKSQKTGTDSVRDVPRALPSLARTQKVQKRSSYVGFDYKDKNAVLSSVSQSIDFLNNSPKQPQDIEQEIGDLLFKVVALARLENVDAEQALEKSCDRFVEKFEKIEKISLEKGQNLSETDIDF